jgi:hypothetical protein
MATIVMPITIANGIVLNTEFFLSYVGLFHNFSAFVSILCENESYGGFLVGKSIVGQFETGNLTRGDPSSDTPSPTLPMYEV